MIKRLRKHTNPTTVKVRLTPDPSSTNALTSDDAPLKKFQRPSPQPSAHADSRPISRDLIAFALPVAEVGVADAAALDLACGTGATIREILPLPGPDGTVTDVDQSVFVALANDDVSLSTGSHVCLIRATPARRW